MLNWILLTGVCLGLCSAQSTLTDKEEKASNYFSKFGYGANVFDSHESVQVNTLVRFQYFANLPVTGELDDETLTKMDEERCGIRDPNVTVPADSFNNIRDSLKIHINQDALVRVRRYRHQGSVWKKSLLTWQLIKMTTNSPLSRNQVRNTMKTACQQWSHYTNIDFAETDNGKPDIEVRFEKYRHNDPYPFDGPGGILAHAFYPLNNEGLAGDLHLDDSEDFTVGTPEGKNLDWVMTHELGHSLGLDHSPNDDAVMFPWYTGYRPKGVELSYDDIVGIQTLYGGRIHTTPHTTTRRPTTTRATRKPTTLATTRKTTTRATTKKPTPSLPPRRSCPDLPIHGLLDLPRIGLSMMVSGNGEQMYFVKKNGGIKHGPLRFRNYIPKFRFPGVIDAAFTMKIGREVQSVLFSGNSYYIFRLFGYKSGPHSFYRGERNNPLNFAFPRYIRKIHAAMRWHRNEKVYLFAGDYFWKYDDVAIKFYPSYPKRTQGSWVNAPRVIDAAYSSSATKKTFFISGDQFYMLNDMLVEVEPGFPQHIGDAWLNCGARHNPNFLPPTINTRFSDVLRPQP